MPLNYSKWDNLELSDDSDIEGHPNVDKKSLIRWKQRDIHEKREMRKHHIAQLNADIACNDVLAPRLAAILAAVSEKGAPEFSALTERYKTHPAPDAPPTNAPGQQTYDQMLLALMLQVWEDAKKRGVTGDDPRLGEVLVEGLQEHVAKLAAHQKKLRAELAAEEAEAHKKITSDDIHDGFESHYVPPQPAPPPVKGAIPAVKPDTKTKTVTEFETLNERGVASSSTAASTAAAKTEEEELEDLPQLTPSLTEFSRVPLHAYEQSWEFIKAHRDVIVPGAADALLVAAFEAQGNGEAAYAKQCVHQSLLLSYCEKLGGDGVRVFFQKMISRDARACAVFEKDVDDTYAHLIVRVRAAAAASEPAEQIQLVPENASSTISFNVPDGPPPERLQLEGPGFEGVDVADVRRALQMRWDVFEAFDPALRAALRSQSLEAVNKVLGSMKVPDAEEVVRLLDMAGILNFSEHGVRDDTVGANKEEYEDEEEADEADEDGEDGEDGEADANDVD